MHSKTDDSSTEFGSKTNRKYFGKPTRSVVTDKSPLNAKVEYQNIVILVLFLAGFRGTETLWCDSSQLFENTGRLKAGDMQRPFGK